MAKLIRTQLTFRMADQQQSSHPESRFIVILWLYPVYYRTVNIPAPDPSVTLLGLSTSDTSPPKLLRYSRKGVETSIYILTDNAG